MIDGGKSGAVIPLEEAVGDAAGLTTHGRRDALRFSNTCLYRHVTIFVQRARHSRLRITESSFIEALNLLIAEDGQSTVSTENFPSTFRE
ncbi:hypothetical protein SUGI_0720560 [Cryptomeria japonica]|nr:hypothetical protein SUGI_0720560 [Cryptomeria japonica]